MKHKSLLNSDCPIARSLEHVGEWWSILILRDAFAGKKRFEQFKESLGIAPNMLTRRLESLVDAGMLERSVYCDAPRRLEYLLSERGRDFHTVLVSLFAFGSQHFPREGHPNGIIDARTGESVTPVLVDGKTKRQLAAPAFQVSGDPALTSWVLRKPGVRRATARSSAQRNSLSE